MSAYTEPKKLFGNHRILIVTQAYLEESDDHLKTIPQKNGTLQKKHAFHTIKGQHPHEDHRCTRTRIPR